jgi:hypothetical protein
MFSSGHLVQQRQRSITPRNTTPVRRWRTPAEDENSWWSITFSDLVLLLLCFVILWHLSEKRSLHLFARSQEAPTPQHQNMQEPSEGALQFSAAPDMETAVSHPREDTEPSLELAAAPALPTQPVPQILSTNPWMAGITE